MRPKKSWREKLTDSKGLPKVGLKADGQLNEKYPGGIAALKKRLEAEGHKVVKSGKRYRVQDFEQSLFKPVLS